MYVLGVTTAAAGKLITSLIRARSRTVQVQGGNDVDYPVVISTCCQRSRDAVLGRTGSSAPRGFTLIELLVVMVIIGIATAFVMPRLRNTLFSDQLKATARHLIGLISEASQEAVRKQSVILLRIDMEHNRAWLVETAGERQAAAENGGGGGREGQRLSVPDSVKIVDVSSLHGGKRSRGITDISFSKMGYVDKTFIHLHDKDGRSMTIMLSPFVGTIRAADSYVGLSDDKTPF